MAAVMNLEGVADPFGRKMLPQKVIVVNFTASIQFPDQ